MDTPKVATVKLEQIRANPVALRGVNKQTEAYEGLVQSMRNQGFFGAITVREQIDPVTGQKYYEITDGLHRFSAAGDAGLKEINVSIVTLTQDQMLEAQMLMNLHTIETKASEYTAQLKRILSRDPLMTVAQLAKKVGKNPTWIEDRLSLSKISNPKIMALIDEGKIKLGNAYALARLPETEQTTFTDRAMTEEPKTFVPAVNERLKNLRAAALSGKDAAPPTFSPNPTLRSRKELVDEVIGTTAGTAAKALIAASKDQTPAAIFALAVKWAIHLDTASVNQQKAEWDQRQAAEAKARAERKVEQEKKATEKAAAKAAEAAGAKVDAQAVAKK